MSLDEIVQHLGLERLTPDLHRNECEQIRMAHAVESLSELLSQTEHGGMIITAHADMRILAAALLKHAAAVIFASGIRPGASVVKEAVAVGIPLYATQESVFTIAGKLYGLGLRGCPA